MDNWHNLEQAKSKDDSSAEQSAHEDSQSSLFDRMMPKNMAFSKEVLALSTVSGLTQTAVRSVEHLVANNLNLEPKSFLEAKPFMAEDLARNHLHAWALMHDQYAMKGSGQLLAANALEATNALGAANKPGAPKGLDALAKAQSSGASAALGRPGLDLGEKSTQLGIERTRVEIVGGTAEHLAASKKMLAAGSNEAAFLAARERLQVYSASLYSELKTMIDGDLNNVLKAEQQVYKSSMLDSSSKSFCKGFFTGAASMTAGYAIDKALGSSPTEESIPRLLIDGCMVPAALSGGRYKMISAAALFTASRAVGIAETMRTQMSPEKSKYENLKMKS